MQSKARGVLVGTVVVRPNVNSSSAGLAGREVPADFLMSSLEVQVALDAT